MDKTITITEKKYKEMQDDCEFLSCLIACGVDSWDGYSDAVEMLDQSKEEKNV